MNVLHCNLGGAGTRQVPLAREICYLLLSYRDTRSGDLAHLRMCSDSVKNMCAYGDHIGGCANGMILPNARWLTNGSPPPLTREICYLLLSYRDTRAAKLPRQPRHSQGRKLSQVILHCEADAIHVKF